MRKPSSRAARANSVRDVDEVATAPAPAEAPCRATAVPMKMCWLSRGSTAIPAIERSWATARLPGTSDQVWPASMDLYRPRPASESLEPFPSPVPTYNVWPDESVGSTSSEPMAVVGMPLLTLVHVGVDAMASAVTQTPPPAAPTNRRQSPATHRCDIASAVIRPEVIAWRPENVKAAGSTGVNGRST